MSEEKNTTKMRVVKGLVSCTYAEAIFKIHKTLETQAGQNILPSPLQIAAVLCAVYERESTTVVFDDIKKGTI